MKRYRVEVFSKTFSFRSFAEITEPDINIDYLCQTVSTLVCPGSLICETGDYAQVRIDGVVYFQGIVSDTDFDGTKTTIHLNQMSKLLDIDVFADVTLLDSQTIEQWMTNLFNSQFAGSDPYLNITGYNITSESSTNGGHVPSDDGVYNLYELTVSWFKVYGVMLRISFDPKEKTVDFVYKAVNDDSVMQLDLSVSDVQKYNVEPSTTSSANKMVIRNKDNLSQEVTYYWHPSRFSGTIDTDASTNRAIPVVQKCQLVDVAEGETFAGASMQLAIDNMYKTKYSDLITVIFRSDSKLMEIGEVGQLYTLHENGTDYDTMLTGIRAVNMKYVEMTFGYVRKRLTQILKIGGRN